MQDIFNMIYNQDIYILITNMFIFTLSIELVLGFANLIKTMGKGSR